MRKVFLFFIFLMITGCASYTGDKLVSFVSLPVEPSSHENLFKVEHRLLKLYDELKLPEERRIPLNSISTYELIQENKNINFAHEKGKVFLIDGDIHVSHCHSSIVVASGNIDISHGSNNILISGKNIEVSHDRGGSLIVANGSVDISFANNTTIYAPRGLEISHPRNVISYNTQDRKTSWGHVNNILIEPLFKSENTFNKSMQPTANAPTD
ncbi:hypothetical protein [Methylophaga sp.]|uniref:hypothetical protein n=1 Tax=Methylophaga sp. TaxID=2024840 RepID=UPI003F6A5116